MKCGQAAHGRIRCGGVNDVQFENWAKSYNAKYCPKCKINTLKFDGCNHITCKKCGYEWCWVCFGRYKSFCCAGSHYNGKVTSCPGGMHTWSTNSKIYRKCILKIIFLPLILLLGPMMFGIFVPLREMCKSISDQRLNPLAAFFLFLIFWPIAIALGVICGVLAFTFLTIPAEFVWTIRFFRLLFFNCCRWKCCMPCCWI